MVSAHDALGSEVNRGLSLKPQAGWIRWGANNDRVTPDWGHEFERG